MPAKIIDEKPQDDNLGDTTAETPLEPVVAPVPEAPAPSNVPEKFKGKTPNELISMYAELERVTGRQGQELGELRRDHDNFIRSSLESRNKLPAKEVPQETQDEDLEFFSNPKQAITKLLEQHPALQELRSAHVKTLADTAKATFQKNHPDAQEVMSDPNFQTWIDSSRVRRTLLEQADKRYDLDAAEELFSTWKQLKAVRQPAEVSQETTTTEKIVPEAKAKAQAAALKAGKVPAGNASPSDTTVGKMFRRTDLMRLRNEDPERYEAMGDEILLAYRENRVK